MAHLDAERLSALLDGELVAAEEAAARSHLAGCARCAADVATFSRLDAALGAPPPLACTAALDLRSALLDGELTAPEARIARAHLASCSDCSAEQARWTGLQFSISQLPPALPSAATDEAILRLTRQPVRRGPFAAPGLLGLRGAAAAAVAFALIVAMLPGAPAVRDSARSSAGGAFAFASLAAQSVLHARTNTLYVLRTDAGAVDAVDAHSFLLRTRIPVGGKPTALALMESSERLMVLDAGAKTLTQIDVSRNVVVASAPVDVAGTPTGFAVDQKNGTVIVTSRLEPRPTAAAPAASAQPTAPATQVTVIDPATKQQTVHALQVPTNEVVPAPQGRQALLVSRESSMLVDAAYRPISTYPGGITAVFAPSGEHFAILGADGGATRVVFGGAGAARPLQLDGTPAALAALPDGRYAVLVSTSASGGRLHIVTASGAIESALDVALVGPDLEYDAEERRFTIARDGEVASIALPEAAAVAVPQPSLSAEAAATPAASAPPVPSGTPAPSAKPVASAAPSPAAPAREVVAVPSGAKEIAAGLYHVALSAGAPMVAATTDTHVWFVESGNWLGALELRSGNVFRFARLPGDAVVGSIRVGPDYVYAVDTAGRRLFMLDRKSEALSQVTMPAPVSAMTVTPGGTAWFAVPNTSHLLFFTPRTGKFQSVDPGAGEIVALAPHPGGGVWLSTAQGLASYDHRGRTVTRLAWNASGTAHVLLPGRNNTLWVGTSAGEVYSVRNGLAEPAFKLGRPVTALALDPGGQPWYLAAGTGPGGMSYAPVDGSRPARSVPGAAFALAFTSAWRVWLPELSGGFYLALEESR